MSANTAAAEIKAVSETKAATETKTSEGERLCVKMKGEAARKKDIQTGEQHSRDEWKEVGSEAGETRPQDEGEAQRCPDRVKPSRGYQMVQPSAGVGSRVRSWGDAAQGDGKAVFAQLRAYLEHHASPRYVGQTALRLRDMAAERRFCGYVKRMIRDGSPLREHQLRSSWKDEASPAQQERYKGIISYWDFGNDDHLEKFTDLMWSWVVEAKLQQGEIEMRLRFLKIEKGKQGDTEEDPAGAGSYLGAVNKGLQGTLKQSVKHQRLMELCLAPAVALTTLRKRTEEEDQALLMILNHELEVPAPPPFLVQSMSARELACFTDIFLAIEYPLYAHLAPGQRFGDGMSKQAIMALIYAGAEAAALQKTEIIQFKQAISRIAVDANSRVVTVTFKGKQSAAKWVGWEVPLARKLLKLVDYEQQRERARVTKEMVKLDYYFFTVAVRAGSVTSQDLYWILASKMKLDATRNAPHERGGIRAG